MHLSDTLLLSRLTCGGHLAGRITELPSILPRTSSQYFKNLTNCWTFWGSFQWFSTHTLKKDPEPNIPTPNFPFLLVEQKGERSFIPKTQRRNPTFNYPDFKFDVLQLWFEQLFASLCLGFCAEELLILINNLSPPTFEWVYTTAQQH